MARMIPAEFRSDSKSNAEKKLFDLLRLQVSDDWIALHSLGLTSNRTKPWAEIDFVLIGPAGVFCLEVKGGRITRVDGEYHFTNRNDQVSTKDFGPFEQVGPASAALYKFLINVDPGLRQVAVGYGVATPDITFGITGPDVIPEVVFDERDLTDINSYLNRLARYWEQQLTRGGKIIEPLNKIRRDRILEILRGDFDLRPSLKTRIGLAKEELLSLTANQYSVLDNLQENQRVFIRGCAGSGKTLLAVEEARRRGRTGEKVLLICYNKLLASQLDAAVRDLDTVTSGTLHSFMGATIKRANLDSQLPPAQSQDLFSKFYPQFTLDALLALDELESFDSLIVDEAQDLLTESYLDVLDSLVKGGLQNGRWVMFSDPNQSLYLSMTPAVGARIDAAGPARFTLSTNCRNTSPVAIMTNLLSGMSCAPTLVVNGPEVQLHRYTSSRDLTSKLTNSLNRLLGQKIRPEQIVILGKQKLANSSIDFPLTGVPFKIADIVPSATLQEGCIRYSTIRAFKGMESDCVLIVEIDDLSSAHSLMDLYVAGSRATAYLEVFMSAAIDGQYAERARSFGESMAATAPGC